MKKTCFKCLRTLERSEFYKHSAMSDGLLGKCKQCTRKDSEDNRKRKMKDPLWIQAESLRQRTKQSKASVERPEVHRARRAVRSLGQSSDFHWHHWSYKSEHRLDAIKLTPQEHRRAHRYLVYDSEHMQYRRSDNMELLDTRARHEDYLNHWVDSKPF